MKKLSTIFAVLFSASALLFALTGCGGGGDSTDQSSIAPEGGKIVTDSPGIEKWDLVKTLPVGTPIKVRLNRTGTTVQEYDCVIQGISSTMGENILVCKMQNGVVVGNGDSGSPVLYNGKIIAVLCYGLAYGENLIFGARAIEDVIALKGDISSRSNSPRTIGNQQFIPMKLAHYNSMKNPDLLNRNGTKGKGGPGLANVIPGMSIAINELQGPAVVGSIGTVSYVDGNRIYAFGHSYNLNGKNNATPVTVATMYSMSNGGAAGCEKIASPTDIPVGSLTNDQFTGILIEKDVVPKTYPVSIKVKVNGEQKGEIIEKFAVHNWEETGTATEDWNLQDVIYWAFYRQIGIITPGSATGTLKVKYPSSNEVTSPIVAPALDSQRESVNIASEASSVFTTAMDRIERAGISPEAISINLEVATGKQASKVFFQLIGSDGSVYGQYSKPPFSIPQGEYQIRAWVSGWTNTKVSVSSPNDPAILKITETGFKTVSFGDATIHIAVKNLDTGETKFTDPIQLWISMY